MVRRNDDVPAPLKQAANKPPYPDSPAATTAPALPSAPQATGIKRQDTALTESNYDSDSDGWDADSPVEVRKPESLPAPDIPELLRIGHPSPSARNEQLDGWVPESLRAGPAEGRPKIEATLTSPGGTTSQQFEIPHPGDLGVRSREGSWSEVTRPRKESITLQSHNPYLRMQYTGQSTFATENSSSSVWAANAPASPVELPSSPVLVEQTAKLNIDNPWKDGSENPSPAPSSPAPRQQPLVPEDPEVFPPPPGPPPGKQPAAPTLPTEATVNPFAEGITPPPLPPRRSQEEEHPPGQPPRPTAGPSQTGTKSVEEQRKETYQIKHIHWYDDRHRKLRPAPILIQNLNGPCPLLALVNALVLSTPLGEETALIEALRTREQVSLGLLLDAVFDELMSGRRGDAAQALPDVSDLYAFLLALHTGMNVNPLFVEEADMFKPGTPGGFEQTRELKLYSTFDIPLIHGWIPGSDDNSVQAAFQRTAKSYDDAINLQFREEELESKLRSSGLNPEEQQLLQDGHLIKDFLRRWPTQLTTYGLRVMAEYIKPGQLAILFRNDHFSTLYRDPRTGGIFTLVTDAGYTSHDEIIWESLVDVNGQGNELFSGDFRPVSHNASSSSQTRPSMLDVGDDHSAGWETVSNKRNKSPRGGNNASAAASPGRDTLFDPQGSASVVGAGHQTKAALSKEEQEDHDLALALQLQEEEEEQQRRAASQRQAREDEAFAQSQAQSSQTAPTIPPRRASNNPGATGNRTNRRQSSGEETLPTYEQAASSQRYNPPPGHPAAPNAPVPGSSPGRQRPQSAYAQNSQGRRRNSRPGPLINQIPEGSGMGMGRGRGSGMAGGREEKCAVM